VEAVMAERAMTVVQRRAARSLVGATLMLMCAVVPAAAQSFTGVTGGFFETYEFLEPEALGIQRVSLATVPIGAQAPVIDRVSVGLRGAFAYGSMTRADGEEVTLSGLTDTELRANFEVVREILTVSAAVLLPTGQSTQTFEESELSGLVAADLLPFRISNWGSGGGAGVVSSFAIPVGEFGVGLSAGYTMGQEFEPIAEDELSYRPGDEIRVRLVVDRNFGSSSKASLVLGGQTYQDDELSDASVFEPGDRFEAIGSFAFRAGAQSTAVVYGGFQHRGEGLLLDESLETPAQDLFTAGVGFRIPRGITTLMPAADLRIFRRSDGVGQGHLASLGATAEWPAGPVVLLPALRGRFGKALLWDGAESSVRGAELGLGIRYRTR
jgi:hypothetical protein